MNSVRWLLAGIAILLIAGRGYLANVLRRQRVRVDPLGDGHFGAYRNGHWHEGLDIEASPGDPVFSPLTGYIDALGYPYHDSTAYRLVRIEGSGYVADLMYVLPLPWVRAGAPVRRGQQVGYAQAVSLRYGPAMLDHVHVELRTVSGELLNPERFLRLT